MENIPSYILPEILSRLPITSLLSARCVCKSWLLLTSDAHFAQLHSIRSPTEFLLRCAGAEWAIAAINAGAVSRIPEETHLGLGELELRNDSLFKVHFNFVFRLPRFNVTPHNDVDFTDTRLLSFVLVNWCRGLVCYCGCFDTNTFVVIWNPIMGQFITVPEPKESYDYSMGSITYGFGFSPKAKIFKLLRMTSFLFSEAKTITEVLTLEDGAFSWRNVGHCPYEIRPTMRGVFMESVIHWSVLFWKDQNKFVIASFNFDSEQFGSVLLPLQFDGIVKSDIGVGLFGGCLSVIDFTDKGCVGVWVMREYGVRDSWEKAFSIEENRCYTVMDDSLQPIKYLENGEILMVKFGQCLVAYDPVKKSLRTIGYPRLYDLEAIAYKPSLFRLEEVILGYHVHVLDVKLRRTPLEISESEINVDDSSLFTRWWINQESFKECCLAMQERSKALSGNKLKFRSDCDAQRRLSFYDGTMNHIR